MRTYMKLAVPIGVAGIVGLSFILPVGQAAEMGKDVASKYILATAKAARTVYVKDIIGKAKQGGVKPSEQWAKKKIMP